MQEHEITERIRELCAARSWTVYRLAKESGITYSTLCTMLNKSNTPSVYTLKKICDGFGITLAQFFDTGDAKAVLTTENREHLKQWNQLSKESKENAKKYIRFLLTEQKNG